MQLGMVGLGRMGGNMTQRLEAAGHEVKTFDPHVEATASSLEELAQQLDAPRSVWLMVPAGIVDSVVSELAPHLEAGDTIVDGGNSYYVDDLRRAKELRDRGLHYVDVGVSGGVWGRERGYCLMIGGDDEAVGAAQSRSSKRSRPESMRRDARRGAKVTRRPRSRAGCTAARTAPATS